MSRLGKNTAGDPKRLAKYVYLKMNWSRIKKTILSTREVEVLGLVSKGFASKEIANKLFLSINTVNNHRLNIT